MEIKFRNLRPRILEFGCLMTSVSSNSIGSKLKPGYSVQGRPETIRKVLVVDDEAPALKAFKRVLPKNIEVVLIDPSLSIREQVLEITKSQEIDMVIMDGQMPGTKGSELTKELRGQGFDGYIIGNSSNSDEQTDMQRSGADFLNPDKTNVYFFRDIFEAPSRD